MKEIRLANDRGVALVDDQDYEWLTRWSWQLHSAGYAWRTTGNGTPNSPKLHLYMHRVILNPPDGLVVDHINRNPLDNRRTNLRAVLHRVNLRNAGPMKSNTSGVRGVYWNKASGKWHAQTSHQNRMIYLGRFDDIRDAEAAYKAFNDAVTPPLPVVS